MKITNFLALSDVDIKTTMDEMIKLGARNFLFTYYHWNTFISYFKKMFKEPRKEFSEISFIIDSGAYSAWRKGGIEINLDNYIKCCLEFIEEYGCRCKKITVVNLDVIPSRPYVPATAIQVEQSATAGLKNADYMRSKGIDPLEVFHQGENKEVLFNIISRSLDNYIGIASDKSAGVCSNLSWYEEVYGLIDEQIKTHGFGVGFMRAMRYYPWYSVDSTTYVRSEFTGRFIYFDSTVGKLCQVSRNSFNLIKNWDMIARYLPRDFRNYDLFMSSRPYRIIANSYAFLQAEEYINRYHQNRPFQLSIGEILDEF